MTPDATASEEKSSRSYWGFVLWPVAVIVLYVLSIGPVTLAIHKGILARSALDVYAPLRAIVHSTTAIKAIRIYLHLWVPDVFDIHGNMIRDV